MSDLSDPAGTLTGVTTTPAATSQEAPGAERLSLTGAHIVVTSRLFDVPRGGLPAVPLTVLGTARAADGWQVQVATGSGTGPAARARKDFGPRARRLVVAIAITDPNGDTQAIVRACRERLVRGQAGLAAGVHLAALFSQTSPVPDAHARAAWVHARTVHAFAQQVTVSSGFALPDGQPWWTHANVLDWVGFGDLTTADAWHSVVAGMPDWALPYHRAGFTPQQARLWALTNTPLATAQHFIAAGWDDARPARRLIAQIDEESGGLALDDLTALHPGFPVETVATYQTWLALDLGPDLTVAAAEAGFTPTEAAALTDADLPAVQAMAALRRTTRQF